MVMNNGGEKWGEEYRTIARDGKNEPSTLYTYSEVY